MNGSQPNLYIEVTDQTSTAPNKDPSKSQHLFQTCYLHGSAESQYPEKFNRYCKGGEVMASGFYYPTVKLNRDGRLTAEVSTVRLAEADLKAVQKLRAAG